MSVGIYRSEQAKAELMGVYDRWVERIPFPTASRFVETRYGETHMLVAGPEDGEPLVVIPGINGNAPQNAEICGPLVAERRCFFIDVVGEPTRSAETRPARTEAGYGEWLSDVLDALGLEQADIYGGSFGAWIALKLCCLAPGRVRRAVLVAPAGFADAPVLSLMWNAVLPMVRFKLFPSDKNVRRVVSTFAGTSEVDPIWFDLFRGVLTEVQMETTPLAPFGRDDLAGFTAPTLIIAGGRDVFFPGEAVVARAREVLATPPETILLPEMHHLPVEAIGDPSILTDPILAFLKREAPASVS